MKDIGPQWRSARTGLGPKPGIIAARRKSENISFGTDDRALSLGVSGHSQGLIYALQKTN